MCAFPTPLPPSLSTLTPPSLLVCAALLHQPALKVPRAAGARVQARLEITENRVVARSHPPRPPHPDGRRTRRDGRRALEAEDCGGHHAAHARLLRENQSPRAGLAGPPLTH
ncbi:MAG: hypothetical protein CBD47_04050 [Synechococcus sp. TMED187]|nr:MAG: hypothetical protein CBD47_04050 [Synechococcus sp. TMED187]